MSNETEHDAVSPAKEQFQAAAADKVETAEGTAEERGLWKGGYSGKAMYGTWFGAGVITIAAIVGLALLARGESAGTIWMITGTIILFMWVFVIGLYLYRRLSYHYELTTQRLIHQAGIFIRRVDRIEVIDIDDVSYTQGLIQRLLGVGRIVITSSDRSDPELVIDGIDNVQQVAGTIDDVRRSERRRRSLHIESI
jgi:membrane protein YdbS with pleckstrin-like domain